MTQTVVCPLCEHEITLTKANGGAPRSYPQLKRYFKLLRSAFHHWPERSQFGSADEMRKWLQVRAGYGRVVLELPLIGISEEAAKFVAAASIRSVKEYAIPVVRGGNLRIVEPLSIDFDTLPHADACALFDKVERDIGKITGMSGDDLLANPPPRKTDFRVAETTA